MVPYKLLSSTSVVIGRFDIKKLLEILVIKKWNGNEWRIGMESIL